MMNIVSQPCSNIPTTEQVRRLIRQARAVEPADLVLKDCKVINVFSREVLEADIAVCASRIAGIGRYKGNREVDCNGCFACPGFIEGHIHIESSMLSPKQFVSSVHPHGTTAVVCDPHEIANVAGVEGIRYMLEETEGLPVDVFVMVPSCVPATHLETSGAELGQQSIQTLYEHPRVIGLAEMMNYPGVLAGDEGILGKILSAQKYGLPVDGHAPHVLGKELQAYVVAGIGSDHECTTKEEVIQRLRAGMYVFIREGSAAKNLEELLPLVNDQTVHRCLLVSDDCHPRDLLCEGHLDRIVRKAVLLGLDPLMAIQMVTLNVAQCFRLHDRGAIAPGYKADLVLFDDLEEIRPHSVFSSGNMTVHDGIQGDMGTTRSVRNFGKVFSSVILKPGTICLEIPAEKKNLRVIKVVKDQILTDMVVMEATVKNGLAVADPVRDLAKVAVIERHHGSGKVGRGFVTGMGLRAGALAGSIAHDSHNIIVVGMSDADMLLAVETVAKAGGGLAVVANNHVLSLLELGVAGLMSTSPVKTVNDQFENLLHAAQKTGVYEENPFMLLSFLALPVIPHLKITDYGLIDVDAFRTIGIWA
jgi:adenine deaminase